MTLYVEDFIFNHKQEYELLNLKYNLLKEDAYNSIKVNLDKQLVNDSCPFSLNFDQKKNAPVPHVFLSHFEQMLS